MRPVFGALDHIITSVVKLPPNMTLTQALAGLKQMISSYQPGRYVYEETWKGRLGGVDADEGGLSAGEVAAIVAGDATDRHLRPIRVDRFLWKVVRLRRGRTVQIQHGSTVGVSWRSPATVVLARCDRLNQTHSMTIDEVGIRFSRPFTFPLKAQQHLVDAFATTFNRRLAASVSAADRQRADRDWKLIWLQMMFGSSTNHTALGCWTRARLRHDFIPLLSLPAAASLSALTWWGDRHAWAVEVDDGGDGGDAGGEPYVLTQDPKMLVPRLSTVSLSALVGAQPLRQTACPARPVPLQTHSARVGGPPHTNVYELYRRAAGGQGVELATLSSYLGSSAHLVAAQLAVHRHPDLPTALNSGGDGPQWGALANYVATLPAVVKTLGRVLVHGLLEEMAAVEFPVYWVGLADNKFVYSRIDAITRNSDGSHDVWEFKTRWGRSRAYEERPPLGDLRQTIVYCFMLALQTKLRIRRFHLRYAGVGPVGQISSTTHTYNFEARSLCGFLRDALLRSGAYADAELATLHIDQLAAAVESPTTVMPEYTVLRLINHDVALLRPTAAAAQRQRPWLVHPTGAMWVERPRTRTVVGPTDPHNGHKHLDATIKARGVELAEAVTRRRCLPQLKARLDRLYGPSAASTQSTSTRNSTRNNSTKSNSTKSNSSAVAVVIRALNRGVNGLVADGAVDAPSVHDSRRATWTRAAIQAAHRHLDVVAAQVQYEIEQACGRRRR
jgi:hypothetical protein